jgi:hypothetical protein
VQFFLASASAVKSAGVSTLHIVRIPAKLHGTCYLVFIFEHLYILQPANH